MFEIILKSLLIYKKKMYTWTLFSVLLLFCHVNAQLNTCITPEGNKGVCKNIWECTELTKDLFINKPNSLINFKVLKSICDFTSVIKICCPTKNPDRSLERMKRQDFTTANENTKCEDKNDNLNSAFTGEQITAEITTEDYIEDTTFQITTEELNQEYNETNPIDFQHTLNNMNNSLKESEFQVNNNTFIIINMNDNSSFINNDNGSLLSPKDTNTTLHNNDDNNNNNNNYNYNKTEQTISMSLFNKILCLILSKNSNAISVTPNTIDEEISMEILGKNSNNAISVAPNTIDEEISMEIEDVVKSSEENTESFEINEMKDVIETDADTDANDDIWFEEDNEQDVNYISLPNPPLCGRNTKHIPVKGEYPWQVLVKEAFNPYTETFCKGTMITREHVLTTANCVMNRNIESILIRSQKTSTFVPFEIKNILIHDKFTEFRIEDDIALITLTEPVDLEEASPICLKVDSHLTKNLTGVIGYAPGYLNTIYQITKPVAKAQRIMSPDDCEYELYKLGENLDIDENVICTRGKQDICLGNEGSPLLMRGKSSGDLYYYQIGILSGMNYCNELVFRPGIFLSINKYLNWILKNM